MTTSVTTASMLLHWSSVPITSYSQSMWSGLGQPITTTSTQSWPGGLHSVRPPPAYFREPTLAPTHMRWSQGIPPATIIGHQPTTTMRGQPLPDQQACLLGTSRTPPSGYTPSVPAEAASVTAPPGGNSAAIDGHQSGWCINGSTTAGRERRLAGTRAACITTRSARGLSRQCHNRCFMD